MDIGVGAETGNQIFTFLSFLISRNAEGFNNIVLVVVSTVGAVDLIHFLFLVGGD